MNTPPPIVWLFLLGMVHSAFGLIPDESLFKNPSALHRGAVGVPKALADLPAQVPAPEGQLTLWADFSSADAGGVPLYLVNQSDKEKTFSSQDSDIYIVLEYKNDDGSWKRGQARLSSWCGNSYYSVKLPARHFFEFRGYRASNGKASTVRYSNVKEALYSNEGEGMIPEEDLQAVALDHLTASEIPMSFWQAVGFGGDGLLPSDPELDRKMEAVRALAWLPRNEPMLKQLRVLQSAVKSLEKSAERDETLRVMDDYFAKINDPRPSRSELTRLCIEKITGSANANPGLTTSVAWRLLQVPQSKPEEQPPAAEELPLEAWKGVIGPAVEMITNAEMNADVGNPMLVLSSASIVDAWVSDEEVEKWLVSTSFKLRNIAAQTLARRSRHQRLVEIGWQRPGPEQITILSALAGSDRMPDGLIRGEVVARQPDHSTDEPAFWKHCATTMPLATARALWHYSLDEKSPPFDMLIHDALHAFFKTEAERTTETELTVERDIDLKVALLFLTSWRLHEDNQVLRDLLNHGGYVLQRSWHGDDLTEQITTKRYPLRQSAKAELLIRGLIVPETVVEEKVISVTKGSPPRSRSDLPSPPEIKRRQLIPAPVDK